MKTYRVYLIAKHLNYENVEIQIPIRGESEEDVRNYVETEFIPEIKKNETGITHFPNVKYEIDRIAIRLK